MIVPALWHRLLDDEPHRGAEAEDRQWHTLEEYKASIVRDLEALVNTRQELLATRLAPYPSLSGSLLEYGLPDFLGRGLHNSEDRQLIQRQLERAIEANDGRFRNVRVRLFDQDRQDRLLRFRVDALLVVMDASQHVAFDAVLQAETQRYKVQNLT
ncbi:type VI secretion system baseplate subunit TssE [Halomonas sp. MCCC 1A11036]|uniref:Type VI secretion system baseplate subunit TssE n=2 Tax=Billgrantia zhangzhouensis TaxID=2733481 RepID=A0ABS9ABJ6_9GAMM|nr:type VI secretion system baseplate subunit TssE [Halomonas zhangzhouensis]MCE8018514.1 type VI secretion system baseplate subunit TssE [Halomonas zhangzhouensis]